MLGPRPRITVLTGILGLLLSGVLAVPSAAAAAPPAASAPSTPFAAFAAAQGAAIATPVQHAYVMRVHDTSGTDSYPDTQQQVLDRVDTVLARWVTESDHLISSFTRAGSVQTVDADCTDPDAVHTVAWNASGTLFPGVDFGASSGNHLVAVGPQGCGGGIGYVGTDVRGLSSGGKVYVDDSPGKGTQSLLHELGHNFSLEHAHATVCAKGGACAVAEYGDDYAIMGTTIVHTPAYVPAALNSFERTHLHIAQGCEIPSLTLAAGRRTVSTTYDLFGRGTGSGTRGLRITAPDGAVYYLDWRNHTGRDAAAYYGTSLSAAQYNTYNDGVTVDKVGTDGDSVTLATHPKTDPSTGNVFAYEAGQTYTDPTDAGINVHVDATGAGTAADSTAQVTVTLSDPTGSDTALPVQQGAATITGTPTPGATLTAQTTGWTSGSCYRYQWSDDGVAIPGARSATYVVPSDVSAQGHRLAVTVTGQQSGYQPRTSTSPAVVVGSTSAAPPASPLSAPSAPRSVRAGAGKASVGLQWATPASTGSGIAGGYQVLRSTDRAHWAVRATTRALHWSDTGLAGGRRYYYELRALNSAGASGVSAVVTAVPFSAPSKPRAPHARAGTEKVRVTWTRPASSHGAAVTRYVVEYATCRVGSRGCHPHTRTVSGRSVTITPLHGGRRYYFVVLAVNRAGRGAASTQLTVTPRR